jgi:hypothetical protein
LDTDAATISAASFDLPSLLRRSQFPADPRLGHDDDELALVLHLDGSASPQTANRPVKRRRLVQQGIDKY